MWRNKDSARKEGGGVDRRRAVCVYVGGLESASKHICSDKAPSIFSLLTEQLSEYNNWGLN